MIIALCTIVKGNRVGGAEKRFALKRYPQENVFIVQVVKGNKKSDPGEIRATDFYSSFGAGSIRCASSESSAVLR